jgi:hypothetical protein
VVLKVTDSEGGTLTITPESRDNDIMGRYALIMDGSGTTNRIVVYDLIDEDYVYDSSSILVIDEGVVNVEDTGIDLFSVGDLSDVTSFIAFDTLVTGDFTAEGTATVASVVATEGTDGSSVSYAERYAALNTAYHLLDYQDADYVVPRDVYVDVPNVVDSGAVANFYKGVPGPGDTTDELGYVWQYIYRGKLYTYMVDSDTYFTDEGSAAASTVTVNTDLVLTADKTGVGGDEISIVINASGSAGPTVTISEPDDESLLISVEDDGSATTSATVTAINTALGLYTVNTGVLASTLVTASGGGVTTLTDVTETPLASGAGGHVLTHADLTGDTIPSAVSTAFAAGTDAQLREVNFAHQLADFCWRASTTWKTMQGAISFLGPDAFSRQEVADWVGDAPTYSFGPDGFTRIIDSTSDNGTGILGYKYMAGLADTAGYRNALIPNAASVVDGYAFGGWIKTKGLSLPNYNDFPDHSYGIDDTDERLDPGGFPIDIGKHIYITYAWPIHRNSFNGGSTYRGPIPASFVGKVISLPENEEPIGPTNGTAIRVTSPARIHATQLDQLGRMRAIGLRIDPQAGIIFTNARTAAHPTSDYTRSSTIRSVNKVLQGVRRIARRYIGKPFSTSRIASLQSEIDLYLKGQKDQGFTQGARASLQFNRNDRILGRLRIKLRMVPPFSIESITEEMSLAADEAEL